MSTHLDNTVHKLDIRLTKVETIQQGQDFDKLETKLSSFDSKLWTIIGLMGSTLASVIVGLVWAITHISNIALTLK